MLATNINAVRPIGMLGRVGLRYSRTEAPPPPVQTPSPSLGAHHTWMAILLVVMVGKVTEWVPGITGLPLAKVAFFFTALYAYRVRHKLVPVRVTSLKIAKPAIAFLALTILSIFFSIYQSNTLLSSEATAIYLVTFVVLVKITQTMRDVERMLLALAGSAVSLAVGVLVNNHDGRAHINSNFDPNDVAYVLDTLLPIVIAIGVAQSKWRKWAAYGFALTIVPPILLTGSRGGAIGLGVVIIAMILFPLRLSAKGELRASKLWETVAKIVLLALLSGLIWHGLPEDTQARLATLGDLQNDYNNDPHLNASRMVLWRRGVGLAMERPIGYGMNAAAAADGGAGGQYRTSHNSFVQALVELGVLGFLLFAYTYYIIWKELGILTKRARQGSVDSDTAKAALYARALRIALAGNLAAGFFLSEAYSPCLWMIVAICAAFVRVETARQMATDRQRDCASLDMQEPLNTSATPRRRAQSR